jgi:rRNA maturation RNase YbeY
MTIRLSGLSLLPPSARKPRLLEKACRDALGPKLREGAEVNVVFLSNRSLRRLNKRFLGHDRNTDVIAFGYEPLPGVPRSAQDSLGDIYVSAEQARTQARALGHTVLRETLTLVIHGALHLAGHDDSNATLKARMFRQQDRILDRVLP